MAKKSTEEPQKPGPDPEVLTIEEDPEDALRKLLRVPPCPADEPESDSESDD